MWQKRTRSIGCVPAFPALAVSAVLLAACASGGEGPVAPADDGEREGIGYPSVAAAREALDTRDDIEGMEEEGWTLFEDTENGTVWHFTPPDHSAHPTAIKRIIVKRPGEDDIEMFVRCEAPRFACEALKVKLEYQNAKLTDSPMRLHQQPTGAAADLPPIGGLLR